MGFGGDLASILVHSCRDWRASLTSPNMHFRASVYNICYQVSTPPISTHQIPANFALWCPAPLFFHGQMPALLLSKLRANVFGAGVSSMAAATP